MSVQLKRPLRVPCGCGSVALIVHTTPITNVICHCMDCRKFSGSVHSYIAFFLQSEVQVEGTPKAYRTTAWSGNQINRYFCDVCGSSLWATHEHDPLIYAYGGIFPPGFLPTPYLECWRSRAEDWDTPYASVGALLEKQEGFGRQRDDPSDTESYRYQAELYEDTSEPDRPRSGGLDSLIEIYSGRGTPYQDNSSVMSDPLGPDDNELRFEDDKRFEALDDSSAEASILQSRDEIMA